MGEVYRAIDLELEREVAIKCVRPELNDLEDVTKRFRAEAVTLGRLSHPNIATVHRFFANEERLFLVMEFIDGHPFGEMIGAKDALPFERSIELIQDALKGLGYAHENNVVHRDIKPGNLMVDQQQTVKVLDFGIAHLIGGTRLTRVGSVVGTPAYMAPEQILGKDVDQRTDLYSIGIVLYEMLSGKLPYAASSDFELMRAHLEEVPRPLQELSQKNVPKRLQDTIGRALAKDTGERFQSASEFAEALTDVTEDKTVFVPPPVAVGQVPNPADGSIAEMIKPVAQEIKRRLNIQQMLFGAGTALLIAFALYAAFGPEQTEQPAQQANRPSVAEPATAIAAEESLPVDEVIAVTPSVEEAIAVVTPPILLKQNQATPSEPPASSFVEIQPAQSSPVQALAEPVQSTPITAKPAPATVIAQPEPAPLQTAVVVSRNIAPAISIPVAVVSKPEVQLTVLKVDAHEKQGTGRFHRTAAYNGAFELSVPPDTSRNITLAEVVEVYRDGKLVRTQTITTQERTPGVFKSKHHIDGLKTLPPGDYDMRLLFVHQDRTIGSHEWSLRVGR
jgi:serine/threonine-protein kinase